MSRTIVGSVQIKSTCSHLLQDNLDRIAVLFAATLEAKSESIDDTGIVVFDVVLAVPNGSDRMPSTDFVIRLQKYVDDICGEGCTTTGEIKGGEDSSYDSDCEADPPLNAGATGKRGHQDVSRTTSDTLAAEYADYVQTSPPESLPGYTARVEFALKLGYTEKLVQTALLKLGPAPTQNELLAELIKLGAQKGSLSSGDASPTESAIDVAEILMDAAAAAAANDSPTTSLRPIVIDGSNVAMSHGNKEVFSCRGIKICVDWFRARGHTKITVFVPRWRKEAPRPDNPVHDQEILAELEKDRLLVFTPSRLVGGKRMVCYDDRYILKWAAHTDGIVVSNDNYRDLCQENVEFRKVVEERILMYSFVNDHFMPPDDPLGRTGPTLDNFLRAYEQKRTDMQQVQLCPYAKKCTYGNKCKYDHPERGPLPHKSVTERLSEHAQRHLMARETDVRKLPLGRTRSSNVAQVGTPQAQHALVAKSRSVDCSENLHRKLQRQLTINPNQNAANRFMVHPMHSYLQHQNVTRIASAPDTYRTTHQQMTAQQQAASYSRMASCSDPQLNVDAAARWKMYYHLTAIFPEEQVMQAIQMYPDEKNPQKICAAILAMFPKT